MHRRHFLALAGVLPGGVSLMSSRTVSPRPAPPQRYLVFVGTYTGARSKGIHAARFDAASGEVTWLGLVAETPSPSFLAPSPDGRFLYAVNELDNFKGARAGSATAFAVDRGTGQLAELNRVSTRGAAPCHIVVDRLGAHALVANYNGGNVAVLPLTKDGWLGEATSLVQHTGSSVNPARQDAPHAHGVTLSPGERFAFVPDLGLDKVMAYWFDATLGRLTPVQAPFAKSPPGAGPRHFVFHPNGRYGYVVNELASSVTVFRFDSLRGTLKPLESVSTLPAGPVAENGCAEIAAHPNGRFVFASNRGHDSLAVFSVARSGAVLKRVRNVSTEGKTPRHFALDPTGQWLWACNQGSNTIVVFRLDPQTGSLTPLEKRIEVGAPVCVVFVPSV